MVILLTPSRRWQFQAVTHEHLHAHSISAKGLAAWRMHAKFWDIFQLSLKEEVNLDVTWSQP